MNENKPWWTSTSIWANLVGVLAPTIGALLHITIGVEETNAIAVTIVGTISVVSSIVSIYGRLKATAKIDTPVVLQKIGMTP